MCTVIKNKKILDFLLGLCYYITKLEEITKFLKDHKDDSLSKKEILEFIEKDDTENDYF